MAEVCGMEIGLNSPGTQEKDTGRQWPSYFAFVTSFATVLIMWVWVFWTSVSIERGSAFGRS